LNTSDNKRFIVFTDGASRGNPGKSGIGVVIKNSDHQTIHQIKKYFPRLTNNQAEYQALIIALNYVCENNIKEASFFTDSQLLSNQINGNWKVKHPEIIKLYHDACKLTKKLDKFEIAYIPRKENSEADSLANMAIDEYS